jgi:chromate reductase
MASTGALNVIAVSGSLRRDSFNTSALRACQNLAPDDMTIELFDPGRLAQFPLFSEDVSAAGLPEPVAELCDKIMAADGVLISSPEYHHSVSSVTKTMIDWVSRSPDKPFNLKPIAVMGASTGPMGGPWGQYAVRTCFIPLEGLVMNRPEVFIKSSKTKFDEAGKLTDNAVAEELGAFLAAFGGWIRKVGA